MDVNELDECRLWAHNQEILQKFAAANAAEGNIEDSEMVDEGEEVAEGEGEDQDMDAESSQMRSNGNGNVKEVTQRKKPSGGAARRKGTDATAGAGLANGDGGRSTVRVGDGG
jgi:casein kinase II subunit beta